MPSGTPRSRVSTHVQPSGAGRKQRAIRPISDSLRKCNGGSWGSSYGASTGSGKSRESGGRESGKRSPPEPARPSPSMSAPSPSRAQLVGRLWMWPTGAPVVFFWTMVCMNSCIRSRHASEAGGSGGAVISGQLGTNACTSPPFASPTRTAFLQVPRSHGRMSPTLNRG
jgi:hypothetical protein